ncbi:hypothetical protein [Arthrobacter sp. M4]|uniref:hypothetical protein n=1 Tax=Arthrobacter sp. M4 TaxID=218160 RepID=UPI001CDC4C16|nr:hypothetical protein [Arthrobacter sp. M4]MCA4133506.1 hypothetical protein [Arthrobacter sp. M4]
MQSLGDSRSSLPGSSGPRGPFAGFRIGGLGMTVVIIAFIVAVIFAANQNDVIGWIVAVVSFGWLALATFVVLGIRRAAKRAGAKFAEARDAFTSAAGRGPSSSSADHGGTRVVTERTEADAVRDLKLDHSFKIVQVQVRVVEEERAKPNANQDTINRALETIAITVSNARDMLKSADGGDEPVSGTIID